MVRLRDGLQIVVPSWMLDPTRCESIRDEESPVIDLRALQKLAALVDQHLLLRRKDADSPASSNDQGGSDEQGPTSSPAPAEKA